jgi:heterodisulfide reductase subunit B
MLTQKEIDFIVENAKAAGAEMIITACPLCRYNLIKNGADIPVVYFTELLAEALGVKEATNA